MAAHLAMLGEEVKDGVIIVKMLRSLPPHFKHITIVIKTLLDMSTMSVPDLTGRLKEADEAFKEAPTSLQQDGKLYLTEKWDARRKKREAENHSSGGADKGRGGGRGRGCGGSSSGGSSNKPTSNKCRRCGKMGHRARECHSKPKREQAHVAQDGEGSLLLVMATLTRPKVSSTTGSTVEAISSVAEIELKEEKVYAHLEEEKERNVGTSVLDTGVTNHMS
jgi:uncharacterized OB-fold protein